MDVGACRHPAASLYSIREQGITICTLCSDVVSHQVYELDPQFSHRGGGGLGTNGGGASFRPLRTTVSGPKTHARPSMEVARRHMHNIARTVEMTDEHVERALGIYKLAVSMNVVSGTRDTVLCACLYAVCRREHLPHVIYDFSTACQVRPQAILSQMRFICQETHTEVPVVDPACLVQRFADYLDLGSATPHVLVCALKLLRVMRDDWIACGRRPMGVCAAALIAACCLLGVPRTADQICGVVRLTAGTIMRRLSEFSCTPAAQLTSIDSYTPTNSTVPPAFTEASQRSIEEDFHAGDRLMRSLYFQLVGEAKVSAPATPERCQRWRFFIEEHCRLHNLLVTEEDLDLNQLTSEKQLTILGLPHTKPIPPAVVEESVRKEEARLLSWTQDELSPSIDHEAMACRGTPPVLPSIPSSFSKDISDQKKGWWSEEDGEASRVVSVDKTEGSDPAQGVASAAQEEWMRQTWHNLSSSSSASLSGNSAIVRNEHTYSKGGGDDVELSTAVPASSASSSPALSSIPPFSFSSSEVPDFGVNVSGSMSELVAQFEKAKGMEAIRHLQEEFDFSPEGVSSSSFPLTSLSTASPLSTSSSTPSPSTLFLSGGGVVSSCGVASGERTASSGCPSSPSIASRTPANECSNTALIALTDGVLSGAGGGTLEGRREALAEMLWDKERRHALPWEFILLPEPEGEDMTDIVPYIILDNEERLRRYKIGEVMYKEKWERGRAKTEAEKELEGFPSFSRRKARKAGRKKHLIHRATGIKAVDRALRGCGAGNIRTSNLGEIIPELGVDEEEGIASPEEWWD